MDVTQIFVNSDDQRHLTSIAACEIWSDYAPQCDTLKLINMVEQAIHKGLSIFCITRPMGSNFVNFYFVEKDEATLRIKILEAVTRSKSHV